MIVFGWNSFNLATVKPSKVDLPAEMDSDITIERVQKYFHLFWIPFFPIGQIWIIKKKGDSDSYEPTPAMNQYLNTLQLNYKTPWYTYTLPLILLAIGTITLVSSQIDSYQSKKNYEAELIEKHNQILSTIEKGDFFTYFTLENDNYEKVFLKVIGSDVNTLTCVLSNLKDYKDYSNQVLEAFDNVDRSEGIQLDTLIVSKKDLINAYNAKNEIAFKGKINLKNYVDMNVKDFCIIDYPVFEFGGANYKEGDYMCVFKNIGAPVNEMKFELTNRSKNTLLLDTAYLHMKLNTGQTLLLTGTYTDSEPALYGNLLVLNINNKIDTCVLFVSGVHASLKKEINRY